MISQTFVAFLLVATAMAIPYGTNYNHRVLPTMSPVHHMTPTRAAPVQHMMVPSYAAPMPTAAVEEMKVHHHVPIVRLHAQSDDNGAYAFEFESADGTKRQEKGDIRPAQNPEAESDVAQVMEGTVSWTSPEGINFNLRYIADENGYRAVGDHLPVAPPTPKAILKALDEIKTAQANAAMTQTQSHHLTMKTPAVRAPSHHNNMMNKQF